MKKFNLELTAVDIDGQIYYRKGEVDRKVDDANAELANFHESLGDVAQLKADSKELAEIKQAEGKTKANEILAAGLERNKLNKDIVSDAAVILGDKFNADMSDAEVDRLLKAEFLDNESRAKMFAAPEGQKKNEKELEPNKEEKEPNLIFAGIPRKK